MKVRRRMLPPKHLDNNAKKSAYGRHAETPYCILSAMSLLGKVVVANPSGWQLVFEVILHHKSLAAIFFTIPLGLDKSAGFFERAEHETTPGFGCYSSGIRTFPSAAQLLRISFFE
jgi:hypothetical protein